SRRRFPCALCPLRFALKSDYKRHLLVHTGEKPFSCPHCHAKFRQESHLRRHLARQNRCYEPGPPNGPPQA
ncbi:UNVERIFIED_CONTAM: hypothetical protein GTU68_034346, partial [Idotea baltica]|nr:hypothetical protein [Idotea baltica]MCL4157510.1 hypothetical protein [Idotea baltica]